MFLFHNQLNVTINNKTHIFTNKMFDSVFDAISAKQSYTNYVSVGDGVESELQNNHFLSHHIKTFKSTLEFLQNDTKLNTLFVTKKVIIDDDSLNNKQITEIGFSDGSESPKLYNYFSLRNEEFPDGIKKKRGEQLVFSITIYLTISTNNQFYLTLGNNKFISFLLGEGLNDKVFITQGNNNSPNTPIERDNPNTEKFECDMQFEIKSNKLSLRFNSPYISGSTDEIVLLIGNEAFGRINTQEHKPCIQKTKSLLPKANYVIDVGANVKTYQSIKNSNGTEELSIFEKNYATQFGDKIMLPFHNLFSQQTPRFISKDGNKIFFVLNDVVYGYLNENYSLKEIKTGSLSAREILKIVSFDKYVFLLQKVEPFIQFFEIKNFQLHPIQINFNNYDIITVLSNCFDADITLSENGMFMIGIITKTTYNGNAIYASLTDNTLTVENLLTSDHRFSYVLAMYKNNFSDAILMFLKAGEHSNDCRMVRFYPNQTINDVFSNLAYYYTHETKEIYAKNRAIVVEKTSEPKLWIYYYPQMYRYNLSMLENEDNSYLSTNLLYLIQKDVNRNCKIYNLVGYDQPTEFFNEFPNDIVDACDFEFLEDVILAFFDKTIIAYSLKKNACLIENVSSNTDTYNVEYLEYDLLGNDGEEFKISFEVEINIWLWVTKFTK